MVGHLIVIMETKIDTSTNQETARKFPPEDIATKEQCKEWLQLLFEDRVRTFTKLQSAVVEFKERLSMELFKSKCDPLTA
jgi:hypothetical protein